MNPIVVEGISKSYTTGKKKVQALRGLSFEVKPCEIFGLIGPDGAGKTSLFRILTTLLLADEGNAWVESYEVKKDYKKIRSTVGYMPGRFSLYEDLSVQENLQFFATLFGTTIKENYSLIKDIYQQIEPFKNRRAGNLSGGMKQKLALSCALVHKPTVLFLDEPTTGVDPVSRSEFWEMLKRLQKQGIAILVSTPYMDEAQLCDRIAFIQEGSLLAIDKPQSLVDNYPRPLWAVSGQNKYRLVQDIRSFEHTDKCIAFGAVYHLSMKDDNEPAIAHLKDHLRAKQHTNFEIKSVQAGIEDSFLELLSNN